MSIKVGHTLLIVFTIVFGIILIHHHKHVVRLGEYKTSQVITCKGPQTGPRGACPRVRIEHRRLYLPGDRTKVCNELAQRVQYFGLKVRKHPGSHKSASRKRALKSSARALQALNCA